MDAGQSAPPAVWARQGLPSWSLPPLDLVYFSPRRGCGSVPSLSPARERRKCQGLRLQKGCALGMWAGGAGQHPQSAREQGSEPCPSCDWLCKLGGASCPLWTSTSSLGEWHLATPSQRGSGQGEDRNNQNPHLIPSPIVLRLTQWQACGKGRLNPALSTLMGNLKR